jgi:ribose transport system substrate-binding protein
MRSKKVLWLLVLVLLVPFAVTAHAQIDDCGSYTIGVSNSFVGSEWRTQMIQNIEEVAAQFEAAGCEISLVVESADTDVQGQIQQIQNLLNRGVDAIIINPGDQSGLNSALEEAVEEGVVVIAVDQEIGAAGVINVTIDQKEWAKISARWLAEQLGGEGRIVLIEGFVGHPANEARMEGVAEILEEYPGIEVVGRESGMWDQATGQQVASDLLASIPDIDGIWTQDGMAMGVLTAVNTAGLANRPLVTGEARAGYLQMWNATLEANPDFETIGVVNPPGVGGSGLRVAMEILLGGTPDESQFSGPFGNTFYVPIPYAITAENFADFYALYSAAPESYTLDGIIDQATAASFMVDGLPGLMVETVLPGWQVLTEEQLETLAMMQADMTPPTSEMMAGS